eukprot:6196860-Pleurochrysis_carterae.AAC.2
MAVVDAHVGRESSRERVTADGRRRVHRGHQVDVLQLDEVEVLVVKPVVRDDLLQERDELGRLILVGLGQVDVLKVQHDPRRVLWPEDATRLGLRHCARLRELVDDVRRQRLRRAVDHRHRRRADRSEELGEHHVLAGALGADEDEGLHPTDPRLHHVLFALHHGRAHQRALGRRQLLKQHWTRVGGVRNQLTGPLVVVPLERTARIGGCLVGPRVDLSREFTPLLWEQIGGEPAHGGGGELGLCGDADQVGEHAVDDARARGFDHVPALQPNVVECAEEDVVDPRL